MRANTVFVALLAMLVTLGAMLLTRSRDGAADGDIASTSAERAADTSDGDTAHTQREGTVAADPRGAAPSGPAREEGVRAADPARAGTGANSVASTAADGSNRSGEEVLVQGDVASASASGAVEASPGNRGSDPDDTGESGRDDEHVDVPNSARDVAERQGAESGGTAGAGEAGSPDPETPDLSGPTELPFTLHAGTAELVAPDVPSHQTIAVHDGWLGLRSFRGFSRLMLDTGELVPIVGRDHAPFACDASACYSGRDHDVVRHPFDGSEGETLGTSEVEIGEVFLVGDLVIWSAPRGQKGAGTFGLWSVPKEGGRVRLVVQKRARPPMKVYGEGNDVYFTRWYGVGINHVSLKKRLKRETFVANVGGINHVVVGPKHIYWSFEDAQENEAQANGRSPSQGIYTRPRKGGRPEAIVEDLQIRRFVLEGAWLYAEARFGAAIYRIPADGSGPAELLLEGEDLVVGASGGEVFVSAQLDGNKAVYRLQLPN